MPRDQVRVVSLAPNVTSILCAIGARRLLVGVSRWCKDVAPVAGLPAVGDCWRLDVAEVMRLKPKLLVGSVPFAPSIVEKILAEPVAFLAINPRSLADIDRDVLTLGRLAGRRKAAEQLVKKMKRAFDAVRKKTRARRARRKPLVYAEAWPNPKISSPPWVAEMIEIAGGIPAVKPGAQITDAQVAEANPDVIVLAWTATGDRAKSSSALENPAWAGVTAVKSGRVHVIRDEHLNTPGPPLMRGLEELHRAIWQA
jgi:iron complex transport system substrate-binding protein